jgi:hypothetical protein
MTFQTVEVVKLSVMPQESCEVASEGVETQKAA